MINPYVLQLLAMRQRMNSPYGSTAMDFPVGGMSPWDMQQQEPPPVEPVMQMPEFDEEGAQQRARRAGLGSLGIALLAGAGKGDYAGSLAEGLAAMAATRNQRFQEERSQYRQDQQDQFAREQYERQNRLTQAQIENYEADNDRARQAAEAQSEGLRAEIAKQEAFVAGLPPELRDRLTPLIGTKELYPTYVEATKPAPPAEPKRMQVQGDVLEFPEAGGAPRVVYSAPPEPSSRMSTEEAVARAAAIAEAVETVRQRHGKGIPSQEQLHDNIAAESNRLYEDWLKGRMEGVGKELPTDKILEMQKKGQLKKNEWPTKKGPTEVMYSVKMRNGSTKRMTEDEYMRWKFRVQAEQSVKRRQRAAGQQRSEMIIDLDEYGNQIP